MPTRDRRPSTWASPSTAPTIPASAMVARLDLSLDDEELERFLSSQRTVRVATVGSDGVPHVVPLWFVWLDGRLYLNSTLGNPTVVNMLATGRASAVVDDGTVYDELR